MRIHASYPTPQHKVAAGIISDFFSSRADVEAIILTGSCARGKATRDSCLDLLVLVSPENLAVKRDELKTVWNEFYTSESIFKELLQAGVYSHVDLDFGDGHFMPKPRSWTGGPDPFELEIGNTLVYSVSLWERTDYFRKLKAQWLPYYDEALRQERLVAVRRYCLNNLHHIPLYVERGLYFQSFHRLYDAFREFLQALFISRRAYPIAYNKWIREQMEEVLGMPNLYKRLPHLLEISRLESREIVKKAQELEWMLEEYNVK